MSFTPRAQPEAEQPPPLIVVPDKPESELHHRMIRYPVWIDELVREAADKEGLSVNQWMIRVVAEFAKRSRLQGWQTSAPSQPIEPPEASKPPTQTWISTGGGGLTNSEPITWTSLNPHVSSAKINFKPPDDDIPTLR